jgi:excisionase family DNA binding protein
MSKEYLTVEQIAKELGLSEETILRWIRNKELKAYRLGKTYRITKEDYQEFLDQRYTGKPDEDQRRS